MFIIFCGTFMLNHCPLLVLCSTSPKNGSFTGTTTYGSSSTELSYNSSCKPIPWSWLLHISLSLILLFITHSWQVFLNSCLRVRWTIMLLEYNWFSLLCLLLAFGRPRKREDKKRGSLLSFALAFCVNPSIHHSMVGDFSDLVSCLVFHRHRVTSLHADVNMLEFAVKACMHNC